MMKSLCKIIESTFAKDNFDVPLEYVIDLNIVAPLPLAAGGRRHERLVAVAVAGARQVGQHAAVVQRQRRAGAARRRLGARRRRQLGGRGGGDGGLQLQQRDGPQRAGAAGRAALQLVHQHTILVQQFMVTYEC